MLRNLAWTFPLVCLLIQGPALRAEDKEALDRPKLDEAAIARLFGNEWFGVYLAGNKIGWAQVVFEKAGDRYVSRMDLRGKIKSIGVETSLDGSETLEFDAAPPYRFRSGRSTKSDGKSTQTIDVVRTDKGYDVTIVSGKDKATKQLANLDFTLADQLAGDVWIRANPKAGATQLSQSFTFEDLVMEQTRRRVLGSKTIKREGVEVTVHEVEVHMLKDDIKGSERYDSTGKHLSMEIGGVLEMRLESEEQAKNNQFKQDLFLLGMVKIDRPLGEPEDVVGLTLEIRGDSAAALKPFPGQAITKGKNGEVICKINFQKARPAPATVKEIEEALAESVTYPIKHARVQELAKKAVGDAKTDKEKVERLVKFCHGYIKPSYTAQPLTLLELLDKKRGDCSEYALLFTALARAAGVPARELSGLVYMGDDTKAFGMHAWNEVVLDGHWVAIDASCNQCAIDATHVCFGHGLRGGLELAATIGKLQFKLVEVEKK